MNLLILQSSSKAEQLILGVSTNISQTGIDRVAGLYVKGSTGTLVASAGRDLQLTAAALRNAGTGDTQLSAGRDLKLNTVTTSSSQNIVWDANNRLRSATKLLPTLTPGCNRLPFQGRWFTCVAS